MRVLIAGVTGFVGCHLAELAVAEGDQVFGCSRHVRGGAELRSLPPQVELSRCDLQDAEAVRRYIEQVRPERVYHLAGMSNPGECLQDAPEALRQNYDTTRNLYEALAQCGARTKVLFVSSSYVYGNPDPGDLPLKESAPLRGRGHPYTDSKLKAEQLMDDYDDVGLEVVCVRSFNNAGPRQKVHLIAEWARQIARIEAGSTKPELHHGNLDVRRDWTDVRDVVRAYRLLLAKAEAGQVFNLGSGIARSARDVLDGLLGLARVAVSPVADPQLARPHDAPEIVADASRLRAVTGWKPEIDFQKTLRDTLDDWREREGALR
jgi:GDP-4-dehydro-6-deoxy-D-mannose reductase